MESEVRTAGGRFEGEVGCLVDVEVRNAKIEVSDCKEKKYQ